MTKEFTDDAGIVYEEVSYKIYLSMKNKHRIIKHLEAQYFVEKENNQSPETKPNSVERLNSEESLSGLSDARMSQQAGANSDKIQDTNNSTKQETKSEILKDYAISVPSEQKENKCQ